MVVVREQHTVKEIFLPHGDHNEILVDTVEGETFRIKPVFMTGYGYYPPECRTLHPGKFAIELIYEHSGEIDGRRVELGFVEHLQNEKSIKIFMGCIFSIANKDGRKWGF